MDNKLKMKNALFQMSSPYERKEYELVEMASLNENYNNVMRLLNEFRTSTHSSTSQMAEMVANLTDGIKKIKTAHETHSQKTIETFKEMQEQFIESLSSIKDVLEGQNFNKNAGPLYKSMINSIASVEKAIKGRPQPAAWRWPEYASVGVRDKNFSNINPALNNQATTIGSGNHTVTTAGTAVQVSTTSIPCYAVYITCHEGNTGSITVGDKNVVAGLTGRRGYTLYPTNSQKFNVSDVSMLYVDAVNSGDKFDFYYEAE